MQCMRHDVIDDTGLAYQYHLKEWEVSKKSDWSDKCQRYLSNARDISLTLVSCATDTLPLRVEPVRARENPQQVLGYLWPDVTGRYQERAKLT